MLASVLLPGRLYRSPGLAARPSPTFRHRQISHAVSQSTTEHGVPDARASGCRGKPSVQSYRAGQMWLSQVEYPNTKHLCVSSNGCLKIWPSKKYFSKKNSKGGEKFFFSTFFFGKSFFGKEYSFFLKKMSKNRIYPPFLNIRSTWLRPV